MSEVEIDEEELFNGAVSDEPETVVTEEPVEEPEQAAAPEAEQQAELEAEKPPIPPKPEWRLKEDAERARAAETELANERAEKASLKQRLEALERTSQPAAPKVEKPGRPDPLLDPEGYANAIRQELREERLNEQREESLLRAREANQVEFDEAYAAAQKGVDAALKARMQSARDPGKVLLEWHRENKTKAEIGSDLTAYKARLREEALKDPEFRKAAMEAWRSEASTETNGRPNVKIAPSLNGMSRSGASLRSADGDISDRELFEQTTG